MNSTDEHAHLADSPTESPFGAARTPRIGIPHLMLWTFFSAAHLGLLRAMYGMPGDMPDRAAAIYNVSSVIYGVVLGAVIAGSWVLVSVRVRTGPPLLRQPGHWLLFISAVLYLINLPLFVWMRLVENAGHSFMLVYATYLGTYPIAYALAAWHQQTRRWRAFFATLAVVSLMQCLKYATWWMSINRPSFVTSIHRSAFFEMAHGWGSLLLIGAVLTMSVVEWVTGRRRDWLHWTGVCTYLAVTSVQVLQIVGSWFIQ